MVKSTICSRILQMLVNRSVREYPNARNCRVALTLSADTLEFPARYRLTHFLGRSRFTPSSMFLEPIYGIMVTILYYGC